jgi:hypothetical protein
MVDDRKVVLSVAVWLIGAVLIPGCNRSKGYAVCGDGVVTFPETCDTSIPAGKVGACPTNCNTSNACVIGALWNADTCTAMCTQAQIVPCCGNNLLERSEICETSFPMWKTNACPKSCDDGNVCTRDTLENAGTCTDRCIYTPITDCSDGDGCCPLGGNCSSNNDSDCTCVCGNGVVEPGCCEQCDPPNGTTCDNNCHNDTLIDITGSWIARIKTTGTVTMPYLDSPATGSTIEMLPRVFIARSGGSLNMRFDVCFFSKSYTGVFVSEFSPETVATFTTAVNRADQCVLVGSSMSFPTFAINSGWDGAPVPDNCSCPQPGGEGFPTAECCNATDSDKDGIYGFTFVVHVGGGSWNFSEYNGFTFTTTLNDIKFTNPTNMTSDIDFGIRGYVFGTTASWTIGPMSIIPDSAAIPVTFIKLDGDPPCATVLEHCTETECTR